MVPGDSTAGVVTVQNNGTAPLKYWVDASPSNDDGKGLGAALTVKVTGDVGHRRLRARDHLCRVSPWPARAPRSPPTCSARRRPGGLLAAGASETRLHPGHAADQRRASSLQGATTDVTFTFTGTSF